jgi:phosphotriesterase-related protein
MAKIQTVLGVIDSSDLGFTIAHEHLFSDLSGLAPEGMKAVFESFKKDSVEETVAELMLYREAGGCTVVDVTPSAIGVADMPQKMAEASRQTGIHVVCGTGLYTDSSWTEEQRGMSVKEIADWYLSDIQNGFDATGIKPGVIGEIGVSNPMEACEEKSLLAAAEASLKTGLTISVHPGFTEESPGLIVKILTDRGVRPDKIIIGHMATAFAPDRRDDLLAFAGLGTYFAFDQFATPERNFQSIGRPFWSDEEGVRAIRFLCEAGYSEKILVSCDEINVMLNAGRGGPGYIHIPKVVVPMMRAHGVSEAELHAITVENPAKAFAIE